MEDRYIGDGIIASFDGYQFWLGQHSRPELKRLAALEPGVIVSFLSYVVEADRFTARKAQGEFAPGEHMDARHLGDGLYVAVEGDAIVISVNHHTNQVLWVRKEAAAGLRKYANDTIAFYQKGSEALEEAKPKTETTEDDVPF